MPYSATTRASSLAASPSTFRLLAAAVRSSRPLLPPLPRGAASSSRTGVWFGSSSLAQLDDSPPLQPAFPQAHTSPYPPWPAYQPYGYCCPPTPNPYCGYPLTPPDVGPPYQQPSQPVTSPPAGAAPAARHKPRIKKESCDGCSCPPINAKSAALRDQGQPTTLQPQHPWVTCLDCATCAPGAFMHQKCHRCPRLPFLTEAHATWDCPVR